MHSTLYAKQLAYLLLGNSINFLLIGKFMYVFLHAEMYTNIDFASFDFELSKVRIGEKKLNKIIQKNITIRKFPFYIEKHTENIAMSNSRIKLNLSAKFN